MENHRSSLHGHPPHHHHHHHHHSKSVEDLKQTLLYTAMELETTRLTAQEELKRRDEQLVLLNQLLNRAIKERDEALMKSQKLHLENHLLHLFHRTHHPSQPRPTVAGDPISGISSIDDEQQPPVHLSPECDESIASPAKEEDGALMLLPRKSLPEKGKLLQAVMKAGPLLQTLLLAGPLPEWRHPPPPLEAFEIPPVGIGGCESGGSSGGDGSSPARPYKFQRI